MSNAKYRRKPGMPRTETDAMIRAAAMEMLDSSLSELESEIAVVQDTVDLYHAELRERAKKQRYGGDPGKWQIAPGVGLRAIAMLRKLRTMRDAMLAEAEEEILEQLGMNQGEVTPMHEGDQAGPESGVETEAATEPAPKQPEPHHSPTNARDPVAAA
ncbi:MAG: hypothetical protein KDB82_14895 [Planctomycetes bacterium]|nr:hypothetical protein [Planctomycetota bacterium]